MCKLWHIDCVPKNMAIFFRLASFLFIYSIEVSNSTSAFELMHGNQKFQDVSKIVNGQIIGVNEAAGQEIIKPPEETGRGAEVGYFSHAIGHTFFLCYRDQMEY